MSVVVLSPDAETSTSTRTRALNCRRLRSVESSTSGLKVALASSFRVAAEPPAPCDFAILVVLTVIGFRSLSLVTLSGFAVILASFVDAVARTFPPPLPPPRRAEPLPAPTGPEPPPAARVLAVAKAPTLLFPPIGPAPPSPSAAAPGRLAPTAVAIALFPRRGPRDVPDDAAPVTDVLTVSDTAKFRPPEPEDAVPVPEPETTVSLIA